MRSRSGRRRSCRGGLTGDGATLVTADISGSPVTLRFHFEYGGDGLVRVLRIRP